jgi:hypothetical protein
MAVDLRPVTKARVSVYAGNMWRHPTTTSEWSVQDCVEYVAAECGFYVDDMEELVHLTQRYINHRFKRDQQTQLEEHRGHAVSL